MAREQRQTKKQQYEWPDSALLFSPYSAVIREISHPTNLAILRTLFKPRWIYEKDKRGTKRKIEAQGKKAETKVKKAKTAKEVKKVKKAKAKKVSKKKAKAKN